MFVPQKHLYIVYLLFMMCPKRVRVNPVNNNIVLINQNEWSTTLLKNENTPVYTMANSEPGFNLTDEEMIKFKIWPYGIIPYYIDDYSFDKVLRDGIRGFLDNVNSITGLHFIEMPQPPIEENSRWLIFVNRRGQLDCADYTTKSFSNEGVQKVVLGYDCVNTGGGLAEIVLAIVGVPPQHNAPNRDEYVSVQIENIIPEKTHLFEILKNDEWLFHDVEYDYYSAGHYSFHKHTANGQATLKPTRPIEIPVGETSGFSYNDIWKIRMLYNYMSLKKANSINVPECSKLFEPGSNFSNFQPDDISDVEPRKRPNKYFNLPDDSMEQSFSLGNNSTTNSSEHLNSETLNHSTENSSKENNDKDNSSSESVNNPQKGEMNDGNISTNKGEEERSDAGSDLGRKNKTKMKKRLSEKKDPLNYLTDYDTTENLTMSNKLAPKHKLLKFTSYDVVTVKQ